MLKHRETRISRIVAITKDSILSPCGRCRELMFQIDNNNLQTEIILKNDSVKLLSDLLPNVNTF